MKHVFATPKYQYLLDEVLDLNPQLVRGEEERKVFPDGERYLRIKSEVEDKHVVVIGGTESDTSLMDLYDLSCSLVAQRCCTLTILIPFFGYSTMERSTKPGESVTAKNRARIISSIPNSLQGNKVLLLDLHAAGIPYYFSDSMHTHHLYGKSLVEKMVNDFSVNKDFVLASVDSGRSKWIESLANDMGVPAAFVYKQRLSGSETKVTGVNADVKGKDVIIYDDMIRSGSSLLGAAEAYLQNGAKSISMIATHGVFPPGAVDKIMNSGLIKQVAVTNSHPNSLIDSRIKIYSIAELVVKYL